MAGVRAPRRVTPRQVATECYWRARAKLRRAARGATVDRATTRRTTPGRTMAADTCFAARKDLALVALAARRHGWTRLAGAAHLVLLRAPGPGEGQGEARKDEEGKGQGGAA